MSENGMEPEHPYKLGDSDFVNIKKILCIEQWADLMRHGFTLPCRRKVRSFISLGILRRYQEVIAYADYVNQHMEQLTGPPSAMNAGPVRTRRQVSRASTGFPQERKDSPESGNGYM